MSCLRSEHPEKVLRDSLCPDPRMLSKNIARLLTNRETNGKTPKEKLMMQSAEHKDDILRDIQFRARLDNQMSHNSRMETVNEQLDEAFKLSKWADTLEFRFYCGENAKERGFEGLDQQGNCDDYVLHEIRRHREAAYELCRMAGTLWDRARTFLDPQIPESPPAWSD